MITDWQYYWRRYFGWVPIQFCMVCHRPYWGGFPTFTWQPWYQEYCSKECANEDLDMIDLMS